MVTQRDANGVTVSDSEMGVAAENNVAIFGAFQEVKSNGDTKFERTGLGLSLAKRRAELHGGRICVDGEPRKCSAFLART